MIIYADDPIELKPPQLDGFFEGWPNPPTPETHLALLRNSDAVVFAIDDESGRVVGFITAITDGVLAAYIPLLEVLPAWRKQGIGHELVRCMLEKLKSFYMIDLICDPEMESFYKKFGMSRSMAMSIRNRNWLNGVAPEK